MKGEGIGVGEAVFAEEVEGGLACGLGVLDDAVDDLLAEDVGGVLVHAGVGVADGLGDEADEGKGEREDKEGGPVRLAVDAPSLAEAGEEELEEMEAQEEGREDEDEGEEDALDDVAEDVVAHLMAEDEGDLVRGALGDGGVPDDDALGGAEAGDIGVEGGDLVGGFHEEHAVGRDVDALAAGDDLLKLVDEGGVGLGEGLELVEERGQ